MTSPDTTPENPVRTALQSLRANLVPLALLWALSVATVGAYYGSDAVAAAFEPLLQWQKHSGWVAAFLNRVVFYGVLPGLFILAIPRLRPARPLLSLTLQTLWCGIWGIATDFFYRFQDLWLGAGTDWLTAFNKMAVNQFLWTLIILAPLNALFYFWIGRDMSVQRVKDEWPRGGFIRALMLPNLLANWIVWIPVNFIVYLFPLPLRVQLSGFAGCFWALACLHLGLHRTNSDAPRHR